MAFPGQRDSDSPINVVNRYSIGEKSSPPDMERINYTALNLEQLCKDVRTLLP